MPPPITTTSNSCSARAAIASARAIMRHRLVGPRFLLFGARGRPVDVRLALAKAEPHVETIRRAAARARGQVDRARAGVLRDPHGLPCQRFTHALAPRILVDDHVLDPRAQPRRDAK